MGLTSFLDFLNDNGYYIVIIARRLLSIFINYPAYCLNSAYEVDIMTTLTHNTENDFRWTPLSISFAVLLGVFSTAALWLFAGLLITVFI